MGVLSKMEPVDWSLSSGPGPVNRFVDDDDERPGFCKPNCVVFLVSFFLLRLLVGSSSLELSSSRLPKTEGLDGRKGGLDDDDGLESFGFVSLSPNEEP